MDIQNLLAGLGGAGLGGLGGGQPETNIPDTAEQIQISSLALIKMLKVFEIIF